MIIKSVTINLKCKFKELYRNLYKNIKKREVKIKFSELNLHFYAAMEVNGHDEKLCDGLGISELFEKGEGLTYK